MRRLELHHYIFIGMAIGLVTGLLLHAFGNPESSGFELTIWWLNLLGKDIFISALKMIIAPLIFASIVAGISSLPNMQALGSIGWKTFFYYVSTTALAVSIGLIAVLVIQPGKKAASQEIRHVREAELAEYRAEYAATIGGEDPLSEQHGRHYRQWLATEKGDAVASSQMKSSWGRVKSTEERTPGDMFREDILFPLLSNPFDALAQTRSLGIIFFAILLGLACISLGDVAQPVVSFFRSFNAIMLTITWWVMRIAPVALGCIIASLVATLGFEVIASLAWYCVTVIVGIALHVLALLTITWVIGKMHPIEFLKGIQSAWLIAFSTTSSAATLPVTMTCVTEKLGVSKKIANFGLPVGATINMDGTALYEGVAVIFLIQVYGGLDDVPIVLTGMKTFVIFITAVLASVGAAAVPSAGLITMAIVASAVGLPLHYIAMIFAVDHLLDMFRTSTNVLGDAAGTVVVNQLERERLDAMVGDDLD